MPICLRAAINPSEIDVQEDLSCLSSKDHFPRRKQKTIARDANRRIPVLLSSNCYCCSDSLDPSRSQLILATSQETVLRQRDDLRAQTCRLAWCRTQLVKSTGSMEAGYGSFSCEQFSGRRQTCYAILHMWSMQYAVVVPNWRQRTQRCELDWRISTRKGTTWHLDSDSILRVSVGRLWRRWLSLMWKFHLIEHIQANAYLPPGCHQPFRDWCTRGFVLSVKQGPLSAKKAKNHSARCES